MKSFFKKLSLVLAAAMIITLIPAQQTKAADAKVITYAKQSEKDAIDGVLTLKAGAKEDVKFLGCSDYKKTGSKVNGGWSSSNEAVATVDNKGVITAVAPGTAEIAYNATGYTGTLFVVVPADSYSVYLADQTSKEKVTAKTLSKVGEQYDLCFIGATGYKSSKNAAAWASSNEAVATVDKNGLVTAVAAGTATIYLTITDKATGKVAANWAVEPAVITVKEVDEVVLTQTGYNTATVTVGGKVLEKLDEVKFYVVENDIDVDMYNVELKDAKKGILQYNGAGLENGKTYFVTVAGVKSNEIKAEVGAVKSFDVTYSSKAAATADAQKGFAFVDMDTNVIVENFKDAAGKTVVLPSDVYVEILDTYYQDGTLLYENTPIDTTTPIIVSEGGKHVVKVTLKNTEGKAVSETVTKEIKPDKIPALTFAASDITFKVGTVGQAFKDAKAPADAIISTTYVDGKGIALELKDSRGVKNTFAAGAVSASGTAWDGYFTFKTSTPSVLDVTDDGTLIANKAGTAAISLFYNYTNDKGLQTVFLKSVNLTVAGDLYANNYSADKCETTMNSTTTGASLARISDIAGANNYNKATFKFTVKDQFGQKIESYDKIEVTGTNKDYFTITTGVGEVTVVAKDLTVDAKGNTLTSVMASLQVKVTVNGKTVTIPYTVYAYNYDLASATVEEEPYVWVKGDVKGLGNTNNTANTGALVETIVLVEVKKIASIPVYGRVLSGYPVYLYNTTLGTAVTDSTGTLLAADKTYKDLTANTKALSAWAAVSGHTASGRAYFVEVKDAVSYAATTDAIEITVRKAYDELAAATATGAGYDTAEQADAKALAGITSKTVAVNVYRLVGSDTTKNARQCVTYINAAKGNNSFTVKNNDVATLSAKINWNDGYDFSMSSVPSNNSGWETLIKSNSQLYIKTCAGTDGKYDDEVKKWSDLTIYNFYVNNSTRGFVDGSRYVQSIQFYFTDKNGKLTFVKIDVNKNFIVK